MLHMSREGKFENPTATQKRIESKDSTRDPSLLPPNEEGVLFSLHDKTEHQKTNPSQIEKETLNKLHSDVEHCECYPLFEKYVSGEIPTLERMFSNVGPFLQDLSKEIDKESARVTQGGADEVLQETQTMRGLLEGREQQLHSSIQRYVRTVIRFKHLARLSADGTRDVKKQYVEADQNRRRAHDALLDTLSVYGTLVHKAMEDGYSRDFESFPFVFWGHETDARTIGAKKAVIFSPETLRNRDFVRDWAIAADFVEQLKILGDNEWLESIRDRSL